MAISDFLYNSDFVQDKAILLTSGSFTIPTPTAGFTHTIAHGLSFVPLVGGSWSTSSDFSVSYNFGSGTTPSSNPSGSLFDISLEVFADATNIIIVPFNVSGSSQLVYVRIFGIEPSDSDEDLASTSSSGDVFAFNTDQNYTKPYETGAITGLTSSSTTTVTHNIGQVPQVTAWATSSAVLVNSVFLTDVTYPISKTDFGVGGALTDGSVEATTTTAVFNTGATSNISRFDYVIYYDESGII